MAASVSSSPSEGTLVNTVPVAGLITSVGTKQSLSHSLETPAQFPVGHRRVEGGQLDLGHVRVVADHVRAERFRCDRTAEPQLLRLPQRRGHPRSGGVLVSITGELGLQLEFVFDAID